MKKIIIGFIIILAIITAGGITQSPEQVIVDKVNSLPPKLQSLDKKRYSGTLKSVLSTRIVDVNNVRQEQVETEKMAENLFKSQGIEVGKGKTVSTIIKANAYRKRLEQKKENIEFLQIIEEMLSDPNVLPDVNDPNYFNETKLIMEIKQSCYEMVADNI